MLFFPTNSSESFFVLVAASQVIRAGGEREEGLAREEGSFGISVSGPFLVPSFLGGMHK